VHGLFAQLGVGTITHSTLQVGLAMAGIYSGLGLISMLTGGGLIWASRSKSEGEFTIPDTIPAKMTQEALSS
jgi:hypothetical protein